MVHYKDALNYYECVIDTQQGIEPTQEFSGIFYFTEEVMGQMEAQGLVESMAIPEMNRF